MNLPDRPAGECGVAEPEATPAGVPSQPRLQADVGQHYQFITLNGDRFDAELLQVREAPAMGRRYRCYAALFALPEGRRGAQGVHAVCAAQDEWPLLLTPVGPGDDGRQLMEAVFHIRIDPVSSGSSVIDASSSRK